MVSGVRGPEIQAYTSYLVEWAGHKKMLRGLKNERLHVELIESRQKNRFQDDSGQ